VLDQILVQFVHFFATGRLNEELEQRLRVARLLGKLLNLPPAREVAVSAQ